MYAWQVISLYEYYLNNDARASDDLPGLAVFVDFAETRPFAELLVVIHLKTEVKEILWGPQILRKILLSSHHLIGPMNFCDRLVVAGVV